MEDVLTTEYGGCGCCLVAVRRLSRKTDKTSSPQRQGDQDLQAAADAGGHIIAWADDWEVSGATDPMTRKGLGPWLRGEMGPYDGIVAPTVAEQQPTMPLRECRADRLARDHRLTPNQARRRASARRRRESKQGDQFPGAWPSSVLCTTWCPCSTSGCRRRPVRHRAPSGRAETRCRTVNTGLTAMGGDGAYAAGPSVRPGLVRCWFIRTVLPLRAPLPGGLPLLTGHMRP